MKKILLIVLLNIISVAITKAQAPQAFKYQAVVKDASGNILTNHNVRFQLSILQGSISGSSVYVETQYTTTNQFGLVDFAIGNGTYVSGNFSAINWGASTYFLKVELDVNGGTSFIHMGTTQLLSVPYALYAGSAGGNLWTSNGNNIFNNNNGNVGIGTSSPTSKLVIKQTSSTVGDTLFQVKDNSGNTVFAVFPEGVRVYIDEGLKGSVGGFAVSGRTSTKGLTGDYFFVNTDSVRVYIKESLKGSVGGFAVSGRTSTDGTTNQYLRVTKDSTKIITSNPLKGFGIGNLNGTSSQNYLRLTPNNYFIGHETGVNTTGNYNLFLGYNAGKNNTGGQSNVFIGYTAGFSNTDGLNNVFIGHNAGYSNIGTVLTGTNNVFIGTNSGSYNTFGSSNIFIGEESGKWAETGERNIYIGGSSYGTSSGSGSVCLGYNSHAGGSNVTSIGSEAGYNSTGSNCVFLGYRAGYGTSSNDILIIENKWATTNPLIFGDFAADRLAINNLNPTQTLDVNGNGRFRTLAGSGTRALYVDNTGVLITSVSDIRLKENIKPIENSLNKILQIQGVTFSWKKDSLHQNNIGFIAQEMEKVIPELVFTNSDGYKGINYAELTAVLTEAMKEQQKQIDLLQKENEILKKDNSQLFIKTKEIDELKADIENLKSVMGISSK